MTWAVVAALATAPCVTARDGSEETSPPRALSLELEVMSFDASREFHLFPGLSVAPDPWLRGPGSNVGIPAPAVSLPVLSPLRLALSLDAASQPRLELIRLEPLTWDDLDGWQKMGVVLSYASAVAGAGYFISKLF